MCNLLNIIARFGILHRDQVRNDIAAARFFLRRGFLKKAHVHGKVFYQLTPKALPLLEDHRLSLLFTARAGARLFPRARLYRALLGDLRFLPEDHPEAQRFLLLGDWQLTRPVTATRLELAQWRYLLSHAQSR